MLLLYTLALVIGYILGSLPLSMLTYTLLDAEKHGRAITLRASNIPPLNIFRTGERKTALLCTLVEMMKTPFCFMVFLMTTHHLHVAMCAAICATLGAIFPFIYKFKAQKSPLPLLSLAFTLHPMSGLFISLFHSILLLKTQRPYTTLCYTSLLTPLCFFLYSQNILYTSAILFFSCIILFICRKELLHLHLPKEAKIKL